MSRIAIAFLRRIADWGTGEQLNPTRISGIRIVPNWTVVP
jgi:hypothetical protein